MSERVGRAPSAGQETAVKSGRASRKAPTRRALELVAMRGRDVIGVRHLLEGGSAWVGNVSDAIARVPMNDFGGHPLIVGEVRSAAFVVHVPPRARARMHGGGLPRLLAGPHTLTLHEGERVVVVLGGVQIRAQLVRVEAFASGLRLHAGAAGWIAFVGAIYVAALAVCTALTPTPEPHVGRGATQGGVQQVNGGATP